MSEKSLGLDGPPLGVSQWGEMDQLKRTFFGRAYGMDIRVDKHEDGTLSVYEAFPYSGLYVFALRGDRETVIKRFDVSGSLSKWLERK